MLLTLDSVNTFYGRSQALHDVSFSVGQKEVVAVLGRNGAGKTTVLRSILGLTPPKSGSIRFENQEIAGQPTHKLARAGISFVPETRDAFALLSVEENIMLGHRPGSPYGLERILNWFPALRELLKRKGTQLSGGQQQMMVIGRGLAPGPKLLLLDEPSQGLAPIIVKQVADVLHELRGENLSIVLVEQNLKLALEVATRIVVIESGVVVDQMTAEEGRAQPQCIEKYLAVN